MNRNGLDPVIFTCTLGLMAFGIVMIYSTSHILALDRYGDPYHFVKRHIMWAALGVALMLFISRIDVRYLRRLAFPALVASVVGLLLVFVPGIGKEAGGARRWLSLGPLSVQPAEFAKLGLVFFLAHFLSIKGERLRDIKYGFLPTVVFTGIVLVLVLAQPDLGTAILIAAVVGMMLFIAGARWWHLTGCALLVSPVLYWMIFAVPWRRQRVLAFLDPFAVAQNAGYQLVQSLLAMARGGIVGMGLGEGKQKLFYLPEAHTDFIYAVVGEELGLIGGIFIAIVFAIILYRGICVAVQCTDSFSALLAAGLTLIVALQGLFNMSVAAGLVPTTGVPLPLVSLGGSSLVTTLAAMGFLLSIAAGGGVVSFSGRQSSSASSSSSLRENPGGEA
ncbi:MAG: putative lipid II flippase FtsW [Nitrospinaceae bacterium]|jgi:cell division protein FtsW|nr:putative lipid II flippase FtsW [Nitrospinaceae bacterium]MBT3432598.1 putative lipid II flippase FtsW [Nitrospinaceae bacterium]MBT4431415.1 putative lipid II flippase FtsW [Nitrospinaceae bacterium]MBT5366479.1 putative lipid II flippase FtsW [Nitrospinaceae bacterium]MBT5947234.1 putative lipid II flippase FtsW [Nitrospinaceae bacterium]